MHGINRTASEDDFNFLLGHRPPYLLHIRRGCLDDTAYEYLNEFSTPGAMMRPFFDLTLPDLPAFHGSFLGHTIAVYGEKLQILTNLENGDTITSLSLYGASGLKVSRNRKNERNCDVTQTFLTAEANTKCIVGITRIVVDSPSSSMSDETIVGIVAGAVGAFGLIAVASYYINRRRKGKGIASNNNTQALL